MIDKGIKDKTELLKIVRSLVNFIVVDSKIFLDKDQEKNYVKQYIYVLMKSMNGCNEFINMKKIEEMVTKDLAKFNLNAEDNLFNDDEN